MSAPFPTGNSHCRFLLGTADAKALPPPRAPEIALVGRSNVGKSSLINALVEVRDLARASNTPGRTQQINFFAVGTRLILADLPGYGFAKAPRSEVEAWRRLMAAYLTGRTALKRVLLLLDARRGVMASDTEMMDLLDEAAVSYFPVLTKADKVSSTALKAAEDAVRQATETRPAAFPGLAITSAEKRQGIKQLRAMVMEWV